MTWITGTLGVTREICVRGDVSECECGSGAASMARWRGAAVMASDWRIESSWEMMVRGRLLENEDSHKLASARITVRDRRA